MKRVTVGALLLACLALQPAMAQSTDPAGSSALSTALPAGTDLFAKYVDAIGGMEAIKRHTSIKYVGTVRIADLNYSAFLTIWQAAPRTLVMHIEPPGAPRAMQFCDGERTWGYDAPPGGTGWRFFSGSQHDDLYFSADFYADADYQNRYETIETKEETDFNGRRAFKVYVRCPDGREQFVFFDAETSLIVGVHTIHDEAGNLTPLIIINGEYKEIDGVKYVTGQTHRTPGRDIVFTYRVIEPNPKDMPSIEMPDELKKIAPATPSSSPATGSGGAPAGGPG